MTIVHAPVLARAAFLALLGLVLATNSAFAAEKKAVRLKDRGSADEQQACTPDVFRLCMSAVPNEPAIVACLKRSMPALSPGCRAVFESPAKKKARRS